MKRNEFMVAALFAAACSSNQGASIVGAIEASGDARHFGISSYVVEGDRTTLRDAYGLELGQIVVSSPDSNHRTFTAEMADGTFDEVDVVRANGAGPLSGAVAPTSALKAALIDPALASAWATHGIGFTLETDELMAPAPQAALQTDVFASATHCASSSDLTPLGCARPGNPASGCTNPSQLPAAVTDSGSVFFRGTEPATGGIATSSACATWCTNQGGYYRLAYNIDGGECTCASKKSVNEWDASCPRVSCPTVGQYDAVARVGTCYDPGSTCTYTSAYSACTPYH